MHAGLRTSVRMPDSQQLLSRVRLSSGDKPDGGKRTFDCVRV